MSEPCNTEQNVELPDSIYYPFKRLPGVRLAVYAFACVEVALEHVEEEVRTTYYSVVNAWDLPGCQALINEMALSTEDISTWLRSFDGALNDNKPLADWPSQFATVFMNTEGNADFIRLFQLAGYFVWTAFNRKEDLENRTPKVLPFVKDPYLLAAVVFLALQDYLTLSPEVKGPSVWSDESQAKFDQYCVDILAAPSTRKGRVLKQEVRRMLRREGYVLRHDSKIRKAAEAWYKCRVNPGRIEDYVDELANNNISADLDRRNLQNAIVPCDEATGWPRRRWHKISEKPVEGKREPKKQGEQAKPAILYVQRVSEPGKCPKCRGKLFGDSCLVCGYVTYG